MREGWTQFQVGCAAILATRVTHPAYVRGAAKKSSQSADPVAESSRQHDLTGWTPGRRLDFVMTYALGGEDPLALYQGTVAPYQLIC